MPTSKRSTTIKPNFPDVIDHNKAKQIFRKYRIKEKTQRVGHDCLDTILAVVKTIEEDIGNEDVHQIEREAAFKKFIDAIGEFDRTLEELGTPQSLYRKNHSRQFYTNKLGATKFCDGMSNALTQLFDPEGRILDNIHYADYLEVKILGRDRQDPRESLRQPRKIVTLRSPEFHYEIRSSIYSVSREILNIIRDGLKPAYNELHQANSKRGRKGRPPLQEVVITNILLVYDQLFEGKNPIYVKLNNDLSLRFVRDICSLFGCAQYCSADAINACAGKVLAQRKKKHQRLSR